MNIPLIHIGYHKTGTTWLQNELFCSDNPVFEPLSKNDKGRSSFGNQFYRNGKSHELLSSFDNNENSIGTKLNKIILRDESVLSRKIPVLSHERLSGNPHSSGFDSAIIASRIKNIFPEANILIVIREQKSWLLSNYFQYLGMGGRHNLEKYLMTPYDERRPGFAFHHVEYVSLIKKYIELFGEDKVCVLPFEMFLREPHLFIDSLGKFLGVEIPLDKLPFTKGHNQKKHAFLHYHLRFLGGFLRSDSVNDFSPYYSKSSRKMLLGIYWLLGFLFERFDKSLKQKLAKRIRRIVRKKYLESNQELAQLIDIDLKKYGY